MNLDLIKVRRSVFNTFALLGDIGGFYGLFVSIFASLHSFINYNNSENELIKKLYKSSSGKKENVQNHPPEENSLKPEN